MYRIKHTRQELRAAKRINHAIDEMYAHQEHLVTPEEICANWDAINILTATHMVLMGMFNGTIMEAVRLWESENE